MFVFSYQTSRPLVDLEKGKWSTFDGFWQKIFLLDCPER
jgi:hypothetical protein